MPVVVLGTKQISAGSPVQQIRGVAAQLAQSLIPLGPYGIALLAGLGRILVDRGRGRFADRSDGSVVKVGPILSNRHLSPPPFPRGIL